MRWEFLSRGARAMRGIVFAAAIVALGAVVPASQAENAAPDLPVARWSKEPMSLEDLRGQLVVFVFYSDIAIKQKHRWTGIAHDIREYHQDTPFALITVGLFAHPAQFETLSATFWGKGIARALDSGESTHRLVRGEKSNAAVIILDPKGNILEQLSDPNLRDYPPNVYDLRNSPLYMRIRTTIETHANISLIGGVEVPSQAKAFANELKAGHLAAAQVHLAQLGADGPPGDFKKAVGERLEALRKKKRERFDELVKSDKAWDAYKVGQSYVRCFPRAEDFSTVNSGVQALQSKAEVTQNLAAKQAFLTVAARFYTRELKPAEREQLSAAMGQVAKRYPETEFGKYAAMISN
jgi:hypothetical protein